MFHVKHSAHPAAPEKVRKRKSAWEQAVRAERSRVRTQNAKNCAGQKPAQSAPYQFNSPNTLNRHVPMTRAYDTPTH